MQIEIISQFLVMCPVISIQEDLVAAHQSRMTKKRSIENELQESS